jgi:chemosensory pili system protein ChpC
MAIIAEELYSLLVPLKSAKLIVPRTCVAEIIRFSSSSDGDQSDSWLRGTAKWNNQDIPVVSFEALCGEPGVVTGGRTRVVVFHPLGGAADCPHYGVLSEGFPQMVKVNREVVVLDEAYRAPADAPLICQINMLKERALIPDLELVEQKIVAEMNRAA